MAELGKAWGLWEGAASDGQALFVRSQRRGVRDRTPARTISGVVAAAACGATGRGSGRRGVIARRSARTVGQRLESAEG